MINVSAMLDYLTSNAWALRLSTLASMRDIAMRHFDGVRLGSEEIRAITQERDRKAAGKSRSYGFDRATGKAVIPLTGIIAKHASMVNGDSQPKGTSIETFRQQFDEAMADPAVSSIVLQIESPGGYIGGLAEMGDRIWQASHEKPIIAYIDDNGCSAAYWLASQCNRVYCSRAADVGSIGVYSLYLDSSRRAEEQGLRFVIVRSGEHKGVGAPGTEITDPQIEQLQRENNQLYEIFVQSVLRGRAGRLDEKSLRALADGSVRIGAEAVAAGLCDGIATIEQVLAAESPSVRPGGPVAQGTLHANNANEAAAGAADEPSPFSKGLEMTDKRLTTPAGGEVDLDAVRKEAAAAERARVQAINAALAGDELADVRRKAIDEGIELDAAKSMAFDSLLASSRATSEKLSAQLADKQARLDAIAKSGESLKAPPAGGPDEGQLSGSAAAGQGADEYIARVSALKLAGSSAARAFVQAAKEFPEAHKAWRNSQEKSSAAGREKK